MTDKDHRAPSPPFADHRCDILIAGAGFAGALTALFLHDLGFSVCLLEKENHPRFAIGESSTPIADLLLRELSVRYHLPWLSPFSSYGSWQQAYPDIACGIKRGFSYFKHHPNQEFVTDGSHSQELLVAASSSDSLSDTNWLRADFDAFLVKKAIQAGIVYLDHTDMITAILNNEWVFQTVRFGNSLTIAARFFIDATGGGNLLSRLLGVHSSATGFETDSWALFSHFDDLPRWMDMLEAAHIPTGDFPYDPDHSALHHVLDEGWAWMLRFNNRRTSFGFALDGRRLPPIEEQALSIWDGLLRKYPTIGLLLGEASISDMPGRIIQSGRLQRKAERCVGPGWAALPHTAGFVDPLFSSGIAHSLTGIKRLIPILKQHWNDNVALQAELHQYESATFTELRLIDRLVAGCYATMDHFALFQSWSMLYFAATIDCEQRLLGGEPGGYLLGADNPEILKMVDECWSYLLQILGGNGGFNASSSDLRQPSAKDTDLFATFVRDSIAPFNKVGLMDPGSCNMYRHTVAR